MTTCTLIILDGIGVRAETDANAYAAARTPTLDGLFQTYPHSLVATSGLAVGLPNGQMGNSEVGHMNLGAGRVVYQSLTRINKAIEEGTFATNAALIEMVDRTRACDGAVHLMGLLSSGGVHSHIDQIIAACQVLADLGVQRLFLHAFLDGRDTAPNCAADPISKLEEQLRRQGCGRIVTVIGRYFALDRDKRWDRVLLAHQLITQGTGVFTSPTALDGLNAAYERGESDEFVQATRIGAAEPIGEKDSIIFMNFRPDRARQLCQALISENFNIFPRAYVLPKERLLTLTRYSDELDGPCIFPPDRITASLGEHLASLGKSQLRIAETEKYAHVTFFFNGGREEPFENERRTLIQSPLVASYDLQPEMSAVELTDSLVAEILSQKNDLIVCNYANGDMVGHTGSFDAAVKAVEAVDQCLARVVEATLSSGGHCLITADHGNVEQMIDPQTHRAHTSHTTNPVPLIYVSTVSSGMALKDGRLCDLAPTILSIMQLPTPVEMTGEVLISTGTG
ncbi:2,3-bisphosphoglycerate-independent phosphoglycerate mutase [Pseudomonas amygdali pv. eriobotryae]|nr:2,3-bisphosphoglycerate-independent phosphoglycerate mutase [Pseudomonas amygdali]KWS72904.1 2,3-bisphosphoglycerate-independent phosphoglycerate mutase [Pseudomonas amygdali pv. eriobotryae]GFZ63074.1 2,3-bisphosphoglycerate-independent phosphoglycerate mutase [Pseudomonas amygdali pv. eriobotryae]GFZ68165.1 2,3-bisphosphoglycerate-independent phosphoglycerate mutase [Pseudomonas amygdali pv. eriobotryae]GFZ74729.1 2,3-bisphosphoglycerate-independent phosphoglycerate mutase [Pseudomonas amy